MDNKLTADEYDSIFQPIKEGMVAGRADNENFNIAWELKQQEDGDKDVTATITINKWKV